MSSPTVVIISTNNERVDVVLSNNVVTQVIEPEKPVTIELGTQGPTGPIGPKGPIGPIGPRGADGDGASDPGDLTLLFENKLV